MLRVRIDRLLFSNNIKTKILFVHVNTKDQEKAGEKFQENP